MSSYGQFCPIAKAMEVLDERWTLLVVRELLLGSRHFNELRRGNPKMSPALDSAGPMIWASDALLPGNSGRDVDRR